MGKKPIVSVTFEMNSIKKQLTLLKVCVTSLLCGPRADLWPFYGFLCKRFSLFTKKTERKDRFFSPYKSLYFECCATMPILADAHILNLGYLWCKSLTWESHVRQQIFVVFELFEDVYR